LKRASCSFQWVPARSKWWIANTWPDSSAPCNGTLQACIEAATVDDGVEIATNGPIDETIQTAKTPDLRAAPGFQPVFAENNSIVANASLTGGDQFIHIEGLTLTRGQILVTNLGTPNALTVRIVNNTVLATHYDSPIRVSAYTSGPLVFLISGNDVAPSIGDLSAIQVIVNGAFGSGDVVGNAVSMLPINDATAIGLSVEEGALVADVVANRIEGSLYHDGIALRRYANGVLSARVLGNLARGANAGGAGIVIEGNGALDGTTDGGAPARVAADCTYGACLASWQAPPMERLPALRWSIATWWPPACAQITRLREAPVSDRPECHGQACPRLLARPRPASVPSAASTCPAAPGSGTQTAATFIIWLAPSSLTAEACQPIGAAPGPSGWKRRRVPLGVPSG
jgi:hypothetical protein